MRLAFFKSPGPVCKHLHFNLIKMHQKYIFTKTCFFLFLNPQNEWILSRNTSKLWSSEMLMIRLEFIQYNWCLCQKNQFEKCSFISLLKCMFIR